MGTRSLTIVYDEFKDKQVPIVNMYRQFDGYPHGGHGQELAEFLLPLKLTNGISGDPTATANGMGCLAAQIVMYFKNNITHAIRDKNWNTIGRYESHAGGIYLYPTSETVCGQDYEYHVYSNKVEIFETFTNKKKIFSGTWKEFNEYCSKEQEEE